MLGETFNLVIYPYRTAVMFGTLRLGSLQANILAFKYHFSCRNVSKMVSTFCQNGLKPGFYQKSKQTNKTKQKNIKFCICMFRTIQICLTLTTIYVVQVERL